MPLIVNDPSKAAANLVILSAATGDVLLPRGTLYVSGPVMHTYRNSGLRLLGNETTIANVAENGHALYVDGATGNFSYGQTPGKLLTGQVGFLSHWDGDPAAKWFYRDPDRRRYVGKPPADCPSSEGWVTNALLRRAQVVPDLPAGTDRFTCTLSGSMPAVGAVCRISDGTWINALAFDVRRVMAVEGRVVILDRGVSRDFLNAGVFFPREPQRILYEGISFTGGDGPVELKGCNHVTFADCMFNRTPHFPGHRSFTAPIECAHVDFIRCYIPFLQFGPCSHDCSAIDCEIEWLGGEEDAHHCSVLGGKIGPGRCDAKVNSHSWRIEGVESTAAEMFAYDAWLVARLTHKGGGPIVVRGGGAHLLHVTTDGPVSTQVTSQGPSPISGQDIRLESVRYASFAQGADTTVTQIDCSVKADFTATAANG